jgi:uncharacterized RDD family membrane protein YckC
MTDEAIYCSHCGAQNSASAKFCANCGAAFSGEVATTAVSAPPSQTQVWQPPLASGPATPGVRYAGFWLRFIAVIIDGILVGIVIWPIAMVMTAIIGVAGHSVSMPGIGINLVSLIVRASFSALAKWIYEASLESSSRQATVGKMVLALKVTDLEGQRISFARATGRHFAKYISGMILLIGYIMAGFTERKQALHDMIAGTLVVRTQ